MAGNGERERNSQLEPQLHEEAPPEQPQSPFILMVGLGWGLVVVVLMFKVCLVELLVIVKMMLGWGDGKRGGGEADTYTHRGAQLSSLPSPRGERIRRADADSCWAARFVPVSSAFSSAFFVPDCGGDPAQPSPTRCRTAPAWEPSLTNGISSEAHDHPPGSVPSGWERWTLNDSDGFRGTEVRPRRGVGWAGWGHASCFAPHIGRGTGSARIVREARPGD